MELDERYRLLYFPETEDVNEQAVIEFWGREGAVETQAARERVAEVAFVVVEDEAVAGLSTVFLKRSEQLRITMWHYRTFVAHDHRLSSIAYVLLIRTRDHLEQQFVSGSDTRAPGVIFELENEGLKKRNEAVWPYDSRYTFVGENAKGAHCRVYYFAGARVPLPGGERS